MPAELMHGIGSVPNDQQQVIFNSSLLKDQQGMQYLVDTGALVAGHVQIARLPAVVDGGAKEILAVVPFAQKVVIRVTSQVFAPDECKSLVDPHRISWTVADVDYLVASMWHDRRCKVVMQLHKLLMDHPSV